MKVFQLFVVLFLAACTYPTSISPVASIIYNDSSFEKNQTIISIKSDTSFIENLLLSFDLQDVQMLDSSIVVELRYASENNFLKSNIYGNFHKCYLQYDVAKKLCDAQSLLKSFDSTYNLIVFDAARPKSIQEKM